MIFMPLFGKLHFCPYNLYNFRVSKFSYFLHLIYKKFNLYLQNTLKMLKTTRVYFGVLQNERGCRNFPGDWPDHGEGGGGS